MPADTDVSLTASDLYVVIGRLTRRLRADRTLSLPHVTVLSRLDREGARTTSALALAERVRPQSMAQTIADLASDGFVTRRSDPDDRRQTLIELTATGREALQRERSRQESWLAAVIAQELSPSEQKILTHAVPLLARIADT